MTDEKKEKYKQYREKMMEFITPENLVKSEIVFPTRFDLSDIEEDGEECPLYAVKDILVILETYKTNKGAWDFSKAIVKKDDVIIAEVIRNYPCFPFLLFKHDNGNRYMVCGEDYQGITLVNIETGEVKSVVPETWEYGANLCFTEFQSYFDNELIAQACIWGGDYQQIVFDVSDIENLPWKIKSRHSEEPETYDEEDEDDEC
jgi:hypothetical protein